MHTIDFSSNESFLKKWIRYGYSRSPNKFLSTFFLTCAFFLINTNVLWLLTEFSTTTSGRDLPPTV